MIRLFMRTLVIVLVILFGQCGISMQPGYFSTAQAAPQKPAGVPAGGKGTTEAKAIEMMQQEAVKKVLSQLTAWSDDPSSPYQQLLNRYKEFVGKEVIKKKGTSNAGHFVLGEVPIDFDRLQAELNKLVKIEARQDESRRVYMLVRYLGTEDRRMEQEAEKLILMRYNTRLTEVGFAMGDADEMLNRLSTHYHGMDYETFVQKVKEELRTEIDVQVAIIGEIYQTSIDQDESGVTATCDINISAYECPKSDSDDFKQIAKYEGSDVIRRETWNEAGKFMLEKAAITSSKAITDKLMVYWRNK